MDGVPFVSLVLTAPDADGSPLLLLSDLAQHSRNLKSDARVSLLYDATAGSTDPLTGARLTVQGLIQQCDDTTARQRYLAHHPRASRYDGFIDFRLYRVTVERGHFIAGFGRIDWIDGVDLLASV